MLRTFIALLFFRVGGSGDVHLQAVRIDRRFKEQWAWAGTVVAESNPDTLVISITERVTEQDLKRLIILPGLRSTMWTVIGDVDSK